VDKAAVLSRLTFRGDRPLPDPESVTSVMVSLTGADTGRVVERTDIGPLRNRPGAGLVTLKSPRGLWLI